MTSQIHLSGFRYAAWSGEHASEAVIFLGEDLKDAAFAWSFADQPGGAVMFTLENAELGQQGLAVSFEADYLHPQNGAMVGATVLVPQIDAATLISLPASGAVDADIVLTHTLYLTRSDGVKHAQFSGTFTIQQGAPN